MRESTPRIELLNTPPIIGRKYLVPHARVKDNLKDTIIHVPVIGKIHIDPDLGPGVGYHYHFDQRFFNLIDFDMHLLLGEATSRYGRRKFKKGRTNYALAWKPYYSRFELASKRTNLRPAKCIRKITGVDPDYNAADSNSHCTPHDWYRKYEGIKAKEMRCPHKGFNLSQCPVKNGVIECPLHGLKFKAETMEVIPLEQAWNYQGTNCNHSEVTHV